jgi:hypothetical protein
MPRILQFSEMTQADQDDELIVVDTSANQTKRMTAKNFVQSLDQAVLPRNVDFTVEDQTERDSLTPFTGMIIYQEDNKMMQIYNGTVWQNIPRVLALVTLTSAGDQISLPSLPARNSLKINFCLRSSGAIHPWLRINNDGNNRYSCRYRSNTTDGSVVSQPQIPIGNNGGLHQMGTIQINDISALALKNVEIMTTGLDGNIAGVPDAFIGHGCYNQSTAISRLDINNQGAGDFGIGSYAEIIG